jgi:hypothetical protein
MLDLKPKPVVQFISRGHTAILSIPLLTRRQALNKSSTTPACATAKVDSGVGKVQASQVFLKQKCVSYCMVNKRECPLALSVWDDHGDAVLLGGGTLKPSAHKHEERLLPMSNRVRLQRTARFAEVAVGEGVRREVDHCGRPE